jgi:hypothetical protein
MENRSRGIRVSVGQFHQHLETEDMEWFPGSPFLSADYEGIQIRGECRHLLLPIVSWV